MFWSLLNPNLLYLAFVKLVLQDAKLVPCLSSYIISSVPKNLKYLQHQNDVKIKRVFGTE